MLRVGIVLQGEVASWLGGINYFRNLLAAVWTLPQRRIEPVILTGPSLKAGILRDFPPVEVLRHPLLEKGTVAWKLRQGLRRLRLGDLALQALLLRHRIGLLSHSVPLGRFSLVPTLGWIADFQHRHLPELFTEREIADRDGQFQALCRQCTRMLVSSRDADNDLQRFAPGTATEVLRFVCRPPQAESPDSPAELLRRYALDDPFFLLPNQFWAHKNHPVVLRALHGLKQQGRRVLVAATGSTQDYRNSGYFAAVQKLAQQLDVADQFRMLGVIPYPDLVGLMRACRAFVQPSLFEGWSTCVEEAKSLGKRIILSNIPVHLEQDPAGGLFFDPHSPEQLQGCLMQMLDAPDAVEVALKLEREAAQNQDARFAEFGLRYEEIALATARTGRLWKRGLF